MDNKKPVPDVFAAFGKNSCPFPDKDFNNTKPGPGDPLYAYKRPPDDNPPDSSGGAAAIALPVEKEQQGETLVALALPAGGSIPYHWAPKR